MNTIRLIAPALAVLALGACHKQADDGAAPVTNVATATPVGAAPAGGWTEQVVRTPDGGYLMGNPDAPVKLIEYGSRSCPHCAAFSKEGEPLLKSQYVATGKVSYEFRDFPIHPMDLAAILLGQCNGPATFFPILEQMMADQQPVFDKIQKLPDSFTAGLTGSPNDQATKWAEELDYVAFVGQRGVPEAKARACLADTKATDAISKQLADAQSKFDVNATPTFIINGAKADGAYDWASLEPLLKSAGA